MISNLCYGNHMNNMQNRFSDQLKSRQNIWWISNNSKAKFDILLYFWMMEVKWDRLITLNVYIIIIDNNGIGKEHKPMGTESRRVL